MSSGPVVVRSTSTPYCNRHYSTPCIHNKQHYLTDKNFFLSSLFGIELWGVIDYDPLATVFNNIDLQKNGTIFGVDHLYGDYSMYTFEIGVGIILKYIMECGDVHLFNSRERKCFVDGMWALSLGCCLITPL